MRVLVRIFAAAALVVQLGAAASVESRAVSMASEYIPIDSWVYPVLERLAALGLISSETAGMRPWTRSECARQAQEAKERLERQPNAAAEFASRAVAALERELTGKSGRFEVQQVYARTGVVSGKVLNDSFHFGQSWSNDYGRPFASGWNAIAGVTAAARSGRYFAWSRTEYQRAQAADPYGAEQLSLVQKLDQAPPAARPGRANRLRYAEGYAGAQFGNVSITAGKQSLWWGPGASGPLSFSNNAEPVASVRLSTVHPVSIGPLGAVRAEVIAGLLGGHTYPAGTWLNAQKIAFRLTPDLELGFTRWSLLFGEGHPITWGAVTRNLFSTRSPGGFAGLDAADPGDRKAGFDFRWRVPGLRRWVTLYSDSYSDDDPSPLAAPRRAAISPGIYLARLPGVPNWDLRAEAVSTTPLGGDHGGQFIYYNNQYRNGNTNYGQLLGSSVGRDARSVEAAARWWLSPENVIEWRARQLKASAKFLPGGSTQTSGSVRAVFKAARQVRVNLTLQVERFLVPALHGGPQRNVGAWMGVFWEPAASE